MIEILKDAIKYAKSQPLLTLLADALVGITIGIMISIIVLMIILIILIVIFPN